MGKLTVRERASSLCLFQRNMVDCCWLSSLNVHDNELPCLVNSCNSVVTIWRKQTFTTPMGAHQAKFALTKRLPFEPKLSNDYRFHHFKPVQSKPNPVEALQSTVVFRVAWHFSYCATTRIQHHNYQIWRRNHCLTERSTSRHREPSLVSYRIENYSCLDIPHRRTREKNV